MDRAQLLALGIPSHAIDRRVQKGSLVPLYRGVYAVGHAALSDRGRAIGALRAAGEGAVLSHQSAAALWGLIPSLPAVLHVTRSAGHTRSQGQLVVHRAGLEAHAIRSRNGLPLTSPPRTVADLASTAPAEAVERAWAEAQVLKLASANELAQAIRPGHRGAALLRALAAARPEPTRSEVERALVGALKAAQLPLPRVNQRLGPYRPDFMWPTERTIVETDGWASHGHRAAFEKDRARDVALHSRGWLVLRFTWRQILERPMLVVASVARVLGQRAPT